jgi:uncharacterized protein RhaS with RHS repeats
MEDAGGVWNYGYDAMGQRRSAGDPQGRTATYTYDPAGRRDLKRPWLCNWLPWEVGVW